MTGRNTAKSPAAFRRRVLFLTNVVAVVALVIAIDPRPRWAPPPGTADEMIVAIAWRHAHGWPDPIPTVDEMSRRAVDGPVVSACEAVSMWAVKLLGDAGIPARAVATWTNEPRNGWNDGHTFIEVWAGEWIAYDIDRKIQPTVNGHGISADEWIARAQSGDYEIRALNFPVQEEAIRENDRRLLGWRAF